MGSLKCFLDTVIGDKVRKVARNPLLLLNTEETRGEQRQKQSLHRSYWNNPDEMRQQLR